MDEKLPGEFCLLLKSDLRWTRRDVARPDPVISAHLIAFEGEVTFIIENDRHVAARREKIAGQTFCAIFDSLHFCVVNLRRFLPLWRFCPLTMKDVANGLRRDAVFSRLTFCAGTLLVFDGAQN